MRRPGGGAGVGAFWLARRAERRSHPADRGPIEKRIETARIIATVGFFLGVAFFGVLVIVASQDGLEKVRVVFFNWEFLEDSFPTVLKGFWINVQLFMVAEIIVLPWAMVVAVARNLPGRLAAPLRFLSVVYVDVFRGLPAIVTIYLVGFGLPIAGGDWPILGHLTVFQRGVLALVLVYGAYVAEVYRAGIESIHWSQVAASRSLGLSYAKTQQHVVIPQAVRRVIPPLLNDFIGLQKDTALGVGDRRARSVQPGEDLREQPRQPVLDRRRRDLLPRHHDPDDPLHRLPGPAGPAAHAGERLMAGSLPCDHRRRRRSASGPTRC